MSDSVIRLRAFPLKVPLSGLGEVPKSHTLNSKYPRPKDPDSFEGCRTNHLSLSKNEDCGYSQWGKKNTLATSLKMRELPLISS